MSELDDVLAALAASGGGGGGGGGEGVALATVVAARGSTYRRAGARLVVPSGGEPVGNISGGCLEGDVVQTAGEVLASGRPRLLHFDLTADDEVVWGWGLGCNGVIEVLVEPAANALASVAALQAARREHRPLALVTVLDGDDLGARLVVHPDGRTEGGLGDPHLDQVAGEQGLEGLARGTSQTHELGSTAVRALVEVLQPPLRLVVCGAGHDAIPLVAAGAGLGWRVEVVDDRPGFLTPERFPGAQRLVRAEPAEAAQVAGADGSTYVVVMSHNFLRDQDYLRSFGPEHSRGLPGDARAPGPTRPAPLRTGLRGPRPPPGCSSGCTVPQASTSAPRVPRRSPGRSWPRSWPSPAMPVPAP